MLFLLLSLLVTTTSLLAASSNSLESFIKKGTSSTSWFTITKEKSKSISARSHLEKNLAVILSSPLCSNVGEALSFASDNLIIFAISFEVCLHAVGSVLPTWDKGLENRVRDILQQSGVRGGCTILFLHSKDHIAFTTTTLSGRHFMGISSGILQAMNNDEVSAIIAHEAGHIKNHDMRKSYSSLFISLFTSRLIDLLTSTIPGFPRLATQFFTYGICKLFFSKFFGKANRRSEFLADMHSAKIMGSPQPLISALKKIDSNYRGNAATPEEEQMTKEISQLYGKRGRWFILSDIADSIEQTLDVINAAEDIPTHPLTKDRIASLQLYARSNAWYAPVVRLMGMEKAFGIPKLNPKP
eukprot:gene28251-37167_t